MWLRPRNVFYAACRVLIFLFDGTHLVLSGARPPTVQSEARLPRPQGRSELYRCYSLSSEAYSAAPTAHAVCLCCDGHLRGLLFGHILSDFLGGDLEGWWHVPTTPDQSPLCPRQQDSLLLPRASLPVSLCPHQTGFCFFKWAQWGLSFQA